MKIDNVNINSVIGAYMNDPLSRTKSDAAQQTEKTQSGKVDQVDLSTRKSGIEKLKKIADALPEVRTEKVAVLKHQIAEKTYRVDGAKVAEKMQEHFKVSVGAGDSK